MGSSYFANPIIFLINVIFGLYILAIMLRFLLQWVGAEYHNPLSQFLVRITHPVLKPIRFMVPPIGRIDSASILLMLGLQIAAGTAIFLIQGFRLNFVSLLVWAIAELLELVINIYFFTIIIQVIVSWVNPGAYNPALALIYSLTEPLLRVGRRVIPVISGIDLSPLVILIGLEVLRQLLISPLRDMIVWVG